METNANAEYPEPQEISCTKCGQEVDSCDGCETEDFDDGDVILCYRGKHYCENCAEEKHIKQKKKKRK